MYEIDPLTAILSLFIIFIIYLFYRNKQGFETFENIFDESYDQDNNFIRRVDSVLANLKSAPRSYSALTWEKLTHNRNHFFNATLCRTGIIKEIIEPLLHYAET